MSVTVFIKLTIFLKFDTTVLTADATRSAAMKTVSAAFSGHRATTKMAIESLGQISLRILNVTACKPSVVIDCAAPSELTEASWNAGVGISIRGMSLWC